MYTQVPSNASGLNQDPLKEKTMAVFSMHNAVVYSKNISPNIWVICNITITYAFFFILGYNTFHSYPIVCVVKAFFPPETSWNRNDIIYHCPRKHSWQFYLLPHYQITVVSLHINCAYLYQPGLVLQGQFTVSGVVLLLCCQLPASACHLHCPWTDCDVWGEGWLQTGQAQSHLSKLSGSQFSFGKWYSFRKDFFFPIALFLYVCLSLPLLLSSNG